MTVDEIAELTSQIADNRRAAIRPLLDQLTGEPEAEMRAARLDFPISISISHSGTAILSIMTPTDSPAAQFDQAARILCSLVGKHLRGATIDHRDQWCSPPTPLGDDIVAAD